MVLTGGAGRGVGSHRAVKADEAAPVSANLAGPDEAAPVSANLASPDEPDEPGRLGRWLRNDPVRAVAAALILVQLAWRAEIAFRGFLYQDDYALSARAASSPLSADFLLDMFNNHVMPGGMLIFWIFVRVFGLVYWPYAVLMLVIQGLTSILFFRLLRNLLAPGWKLLIPLCLLLFSPLTLEGTAMWTTGSMLLPMQLAMVLAIGAQVKYVRTKRTRHLVTLGASYLLGLVFFEKTLLIAPLVFLLTACILVRGGVFRSLARTVREYWPSWLVLTAISGGYLVLYLNQARLDCNPIACGETLRDPGSVGEVLTFIQQLIGATLIPGLLGGPWHWLDITGPTWLAEPPEVLRWLAWTVFLGVVVVTILMRPIATRAWTFFGLYVIIGTALLTATRVGTFLGDLAGLVPRYVADMVVVAAICIGVALSGLRVSADATPAPSATRSLRREPALVVVGSILATVAIGLFAVGVGLSSAQFADTWAVQPGRDYLNAVKADLAKAPQGTVFIDGPVPPQVAGSYFYPNNFQTRLLRALRPAPVFVTEAENPSTFDDDGHIRPARVDGVSSRPGPITALDCGYQVTGGGTVRIPLDVAVFDWPWMVRMGYLSDGDSPAALRLGNSTYEFQVKRGLHQIFFPLAGGGDAVELTVRNPAVRLCTNDIDVGLLTAQQ